MNINEQMDQLGRIGSVGYAPTDAMIDGLLAKTKRARAVRQSSAAVVGSASAVALGIVGAQVYVTVDHRNDAATQDRNIENGLPGVFNFDGKYGAGYNGMDEQTRADLDKIYKDLNIAAQIQAKHLAEQQAAADAAAAQAAANAAAAAASSANTGTANTGTGSGTTTETTAPPNSSTFTNPWDGQPTTCGTSGTWTAPGGAGYYSCTTGKWSFNASYFMFGNGEVYKCENWTDYATGFTFQGAMSDKPVSGTNTGGWENKRIRCSVGTVYKRTLDQSSDYWYMGGELSSTTGNVCKGSTVTVWGAKQRYSCLREDELQSHYPTWTGDMTGGNTPWTQNNGARKILVEPANYKWFPPCGQYYSITSEPAGYYWTGSTWLEKPTAPDPSPSTPTA